MFVTFSQTLGKFGGTRIGVGYRCKNKNAPLFALFIIFFASVLKMIWCMTVLVFWLVYAIFYCSFWLIRLAVVTIAEKVKTRKNKTFSEKAGETVKNE